jgi:phosphoglycerate dehydrogenase-like enzyme
MSNRDRPAANGVLVACGDAAEYPPLLQELASESIELGFASNTEEALAAWSGQAVLLAQPDIAAALVDQLPGIRWVQSTWAGITPLLHTQRQDFLLTGIKNVFGAQMAEYTLGYLLAHELKLVQRLEKQKSGQWWPEYTGRLSGKTLGIMGLGSIGGHIARVAAGFGLRLIGLTRTGSPQTGVQQVYTVSRLHEFLAQADHVVAVLPDTPATTGLMNAAAFAAMKPAALFINVGRGNLVDEAALAAALQLGQIAGAVLDVFREEPLPANSPLWCAPNLAITAHIATRSWPEDVAGIFVDNFRRFQNGQELNYLVDRNRGY